MGTDDHAKNGDVRAMMPAEIGRSYDTLADHWNSDDFPRDYGIELHRRALAFAPADGFALDIGCGSSGRFIDLMLEHGFEAEGLDISARMIELAGQRHPGVTFHHADICEWAFPRRYQFISAWDSIWHVPLGRQEQVLDRVLRALAPGGVCIFTTGGVDSPGEKRDAAMGTPMYHGAPGLPAVLQIVANAGTVCRHLEYDCYPELHVCLVVQAPNDAG